MLKFRFSNVLFDRIRSLGFPEKQIVSRNMLNNLYANNQSKRVVKHDKLYPRPVSVNLTNTTVPSRTRLTFDQIFEIIPSIQVTNKDMAQTDEYYGINTNTYYTGQTVEYYGDIVANPRDYLISYTNMSLKAKIDVNNLGICAIGGGGGGGRDTGSNDGDSVGGGGGGAYVYAVINAKKDDVIELSIGIGGLGGGYYDGNTTTGQSGGTTRVTKSLWSEPLVNGMVKQSYISALGGTGGHGGGRGSGGNLVEVVSNGDISEWASYYGGNGGDEAPGATSTLASYSIVTPINNEVPYPSDVRDALNAFFGKYGNITQDLMSYGGGGGGAGSKANDEHYNAGYGATNGTGGIRGWRDDNVVKGPGIPGINGGGGGGGADNGHWGGQGGKGCVIMYVEAQYAEQAYM